MIVSIHQPAYLPWLGYLDRIAQSDVFIFLDTVQFEKNSFTNRNRIKTANGPLWLTVPVLSQGHIGKRLQELRIDNRQDWRTKHLRSIEQNYRKAPYFAERFPRLKALYGHAQDSLTELCFTQLKFWMAEFGLRARLLRASELAVEGAKSDLVLALAAAAGASAYISGPQGRGYLDEASFREAGIKLHYHDFSPTPYPQLYGEFAPAMAALDYWMNVAEPQNFRQMEKPEETP
ncbi:MAG TPA: WbqC family protein [Rhizomicrobium sp.]|nr:WbqC family protein [Rhizomicrobium sp.]